MTTLSEKILAQYQVRKSTRQKDAFIDFLKEALPELQVQTYKSSKSRNLILGDVNRVKILLTAHYDTCARMPIPNFITPMNPLFTVLYGILLVIPIFLTVFLVNVILCLFVDSFWLQYWVSVILAFGLLSLSILGPANSHTVNDNTSGVITLCELYQGLSDVQRDQVAFIFFDNEEKGLLGSSVFRKQYKNQLRSKLLINFDCVSDGDHILLAVSKKARIAYTEKFQAAFLGSVNKNMLLKKAENVYYPSDQAGFPMSVAVASLKHNKVLGYYLDRIHTSKDTILDTQNIVLLCRSIHSLIDLL